MRRISAYAKLLCDHTCQHSIPTSECVETQDLSNLVSRYLPITRRERNGKRKGGKGNATYFLPTQFLGPALNGCIASARSLLYLGSPRNRSGTKLYGSVQ